MIREHDIKWFMEDPTRLTLMKPFTRGGGMNLHGYEGDDILNNTILNTGFANLNLHPISQDTYITEYRPDLHHIILNETIPHISVRINGTELPSNLINITQTCSFQKLIHSAHVRNLTANQLEFNLCNQDPDESETNAFSEVTFSSSLSFSPLKLTFLLRQTYLPLRVRQISEGQVLSDRVLLSLAYAAPLLIGFIFPFSCNDI